MTPALAQMAAPSGFSRHGHIYVPSARDRAKLAWFSKDRIRAGGGPGGRPTMLCSPGMFGSMGAGPGVGSFVGYDVWMRDAASALHYSGATPEEIYDPGSAIGPSGTIVGKVAGNVLSPVGTPDYAQALTGLAGDPLGAGFTDASTDSFDAANAAAHDNTTNAFAVLSVFRITTPPGAVASTALAKRQGAPSYLGWETRFTDAVGLHVNFTGSSGSNNFTPTPQGAKVAGLYWMLVWGSASSAALGVDCNFGSSSGPWIVGSITSNVALGVGSQRLPALGCTAGPLLWWRGPGAEVVVVNRLTWLPAWELATGAFA